MHWILMNDEKFDSLKLLKMKYRRDRQNNSELVWWRNLMNDDEFASLKL